MKNASKACLRALLLLLLSCAASAQVLRVDADAPPFGNGISWPLAYDELRDALQVAATNPAITEIWVAEGVYTPATTDPSVAFDLRSGLAVYGGFAGTETSRDQRDPQAHVTTLSGDLLGDDAPGFVNYADNSWSVVRAVSADESARLDGFTIRGGSGAFRAGGGLFSMNSSPTLSRLIFQENEAYSMGGALPAGGAIYFVGTGMLSVSDARFESNRSTFGGAIYASFLPSSDPAVDLRRCEFISNEATTGGACALDSDPLLYDVRFVLDECTFRDNQATSGGALRLNGFDDLEVLECLFESNRATSGGALDVNSCCGVDPTTTFVGCSFLANQGCGGGALFLRPGAHEVRECRFEGNRRSGGCGFGSGGGAILAEGQGTLVDIVNSVFVANRDQVLGRGGARLDLAGCSFFNDGNQASLLVNSATANLANCILWGQRDPQIAGEANVTASYCDVRSGGTPLAGSGNLDVDPLFVDPSLGDLHLQPGSPCLDAGNPATQGTATLDFEGDPRFVDGDLDGNLRIDMGADELDPIHLEITGTIAPGGNIVIDLTGPPGLVTILGVGPPGAFFLNRFGPLFLSPGPSLRMSWPSAPSSVPVMLPANVPAGTLAVQVLALNGAGGIFSNPVFLDL